MTERERKIFDLQDPSTKKLMMAQALRPIEDNANYITQLRMTEITKGAQCVKEDGSIDLNVRNITQEEANSYQGFRQGRGSIIERLWKDVQKSTLNEEKRERATTAFMVGSTLESIKRRFKGIMKGLFQPSYAERVAEEMRKKMNEN